MQASRQHCDPSAGTQFYVEAFQEAAKGQCWDVNVIDTKGDVAAVISRGAISGR